MLRRLVSSRAFLIEAFVCAILLAVLAIASCYFLRSLVERVHAAGFALAGVVAFRTAFGALRRYLLATLERPAGGIVDAVIFDGTLVALALVLLWCHAPEIALVATACAPLAALGALALRPAVRRRAQLAIDHREAATAHADEDRVGAAAIEALDQQAARAELGRVRRARAAASAYALEKLAIAASAVASFATGLAWVAVLWYGIERAMPLGDLVFCAAVVAYLLPAIERLAVVDVAIQTIERDDRRFEPRPRGKPFPGLAGAIAVRDVSFGYGRGKVFDRLGLTIPAGETVAIVGDSGSGKTTLFELLLRLREPSAGQLLFDGVDARDLDPASLRARIALLSQEPVLFAGTLRDNIAIARPGASLEDVARAAMLAGLGDVIASLPQRFETTIGERGVGLSSSQRQQLAIARALVADPDVVLFDDATSQLDPATERAVHATLRSTLAGKTLVIAAHRLSTVREANIIYVLGNGRVVERGTHAELIDFNGRYAALVRAQLDDLGGGPRHMRARKVFQPHVANRVAR